MDNYVWRCYLSRNVIGMPLLWDFFRCSADGFLNVIRNRRLFLDTSKYLSTELKCRELFDCMNPRIMISL